MAWQLAYSELQARLGDSRSEMTLYVVCGIQGSGKTTWIERNAAHLGPTSIFFDAALPARRHRARALEMARAVGATAVAVWLNVPLEVALQRNSERREDERVPEEALRSVASILEPPSLKEGFAEVVEIDVSGQRVGSPT